MSGFRVEIMRLSTLDTMPLRHCDSIPEVVRFIEGHKAAVEERSAKELVGAGVYYVFELDGDKEHPVAL